MGALIGVRAIDGANSDWSRQVRLTQFESAVQTQFSAAEAASIGEEVESYAEAEKAAIDALMDLSEEEPNPDLEDLTAKFVQLRRDFRKSLNFSAKGKYEWAREYDAMATDPHLQSLLALIHHISADLRIEAEQNHSNSVKLHIFGAIASSLLASFLFVAYQNRSSQILKLLHEKEYSQSSERLLAGLLSNNEDLIALLDESGCFRMITGPVELHWRKPPERLIGMTPMDLCHPNDLGHLGFFLKRVKEGENNLRSEFRLWDGEGGFKPFRIHFSDHRRNPDLRGILLTFHDLSERKNFERELSHQAFHDLLTGLPNRAMLTSSLPQRVSRARVDGGKIVVLFLDLDNFKLINDTLGHEVGDKLLLAVAERLQGHLDPGSTLYRIGGDEFVILAPTDATLDTTRRMAQRLIKGMHAPFVINGREIFGSCSIGLTCAEGTGADPDSMLREADTAMYQAKAEGKSSYAVFTPEMNDQALERLDLESDLRRLVYNEQLVLHYQPIVDLETLDLTQFEVLVRWQHPTRGLISPLKFIPIAEDTGLICQIGHWILHEACRQLHAWNISRAGMPPFKMSINVSGRQFQEQDFVHQVKQVLLDTRVDPTHVELEITESVMLRDFDKSLSTLTSLRDLGVRIAIDDFGTGYSSMSYLSRLPIDKLKIDRSFITALTEEHGEHIVRAIIAMAKNLGLIVTSEGIENRNQQDVLRLMGCELGQGYLYARPLSVPEVETMLGHAEQTRKAA